MYAIKEIYYTLQGEGARVGRPAVLCRFSGCNLWNGLEEDREQAICRFCDTAFVGVDGPGGGRFSDADAVADAVARAWPSEARPRARPYVVCTGGEPLLQLDEPLIEAFHAANFEVAVETNGTCLAPVGLDWICVSPKAGTELVVRSGHELKLVYPQVGLDPHVFECLDFEHFYLQPLDNIQRKSNVERAIRYCLTRPMWSLSLQTHKLLGIA